MSEAGDKIAHLDILITHQQEHIQLLEEHLQELQTEREEWSLHLPTTENIKMVMSWGWTQRAIAEYFHVSQPTISRVRQTVKNKEDNDAQTTGG
jgi:predicted XRE-type DNA-binding protein